LGGETTIGAHSTIGANVFLMESVPPNSLVTNEKSQVRIVSKRDLTAQRNGAAELRPEYEI
jgi:serine O-acetyltransferase